VRTESTALDFQGKKLPVIPGMTVTADVFTGEKSVLDYLLKPVNKARERALRER
jgi:adhesin transport system membrane fusion protein